MVPELRKKYNSEFTEKKYNDFVNDLLASTIYQLDFRVSETPLFLTKELTEKLIKASEEIVSQLQSEEFKKKSKSAVPAELSEHNDDNHPSFLQIDYAICKEGKEYVPRLIELQGFPTTYCFQALKSEKYREYFSIPDNLTSYFNGMNKRSYLDLLSSILLGDADPENVILLEIDPEHQKSRSDFICTKQMIGIDTVNISEVLKKGKKLFYKKNGKEIPIKRIYNRVIYNELIKKNIRLNFKFTDKLDIEWVDHPSWFMRISKHSLPFLKGEFIPVTYYLSELDKYPDDIENFVLKPLYSFSGSGVILDINVEMLDKINDKSNYILQRKVEYAPLIETPDGYSMAEIRMIFFWEHRPLLVNNLVRMSKGKMMGVDFNKNKTWVGSSVAYHHLTKK